MWRFIYSATLTLLLSMSPVIAKDVRVLAFGDSNTWGWKAVGNGFPATRHQDEERWAGVLEAALDGATVVVDGLVGRRTDLDGNADLGLLEADDFNGARDLPEAIARHMPVDLVVIMLGTNDLQSGVDRTPADVAKSAFGLANLVTGSDKPVYSAYPAPKVLVVAPPPMRDTTATPLSGLFQSGVAPSRQLGAAFSAEATRTGIPFFDAGSVTGTDGIDGVHLTKGNHAALGNALAPVIRPLIGIED